MDTDLTVAMMATTLIDDYTFNATDDGLCGMTLEDDGISCSMYLISSKAMEQL